MNPDNKNLQPNQIQPDYSFITDQPGASSPKKTDKKVALIVVLLIILAIMGVASLVFSNAEKSVKEEQTAEEKSFTEKVNTTDAKFVVKYPAGWKATENVEFESISQVDLVSADEKIKISIYSNAENNEPVEPQNTIDDSQYKEMLSYSLSEVVSEYENVEFSDINEISVSFSENKYMQKQAFYEKDGEKFSTMFSQSTNPNSKTQIFFEAEFPEDSQETVLAILNSIEVSNE